MSGGDGWTTERFLDRLGAWPIDEQTDEAEEMKYLVVIEVDGQDSFVFPTEVMYDVDAKLLVIKARR